MSLQQPANAGVGLPGSPIVVDSEMMGVSAGGDNSPQAQTRHNASVTSSPGSITTGNCQAVVNSDINNDGSVSSAGSISDGNDYRRAARDNDADDESSGFDGAEIARRIRLSSFEMANGSPRTTHHSAAALAQLVSSSSATQHASAQRKNSGNAAGVTSVASNISRKNSGNNNNNNNNNNNSNNSNSNNSNNSNSNNSNNSNSNNSNSNTSATNAVGAEPVLNSPSAPRSNVAVSGQAWAGPTSAPTAGGTAGGVNTLGNYRLSSKRKSISALSGGIPEDSSVTTFAPRRQSQPLVNVPENPLKETALEVGEEDGECGSDGTDSELDSADEEDRRKYRMSLTTLGFVEKEVESEYQASRASLHYRTLRLSLIFMSVFNVVMTVVLGLGGWGKGARDARGYARYYPIMVALSLGTLIVTAAFVNKWYRGFAHMAMRWRRSFALLFVLANNSAIFTVMGLVGEAGFTPWVWHWIVCIPLLFEGSYVSTILLCSIVVGTGVQIIASGVGSDFPGTMLVLLPLGLAAIFVGLAARTMDHGFRRVWIVQRRVGQRRRNLQKERAQMEALLRLQLPESIINQLKGHQQSLRRASIINTDDFAEAGALEEKSFAQRVPMVTVIFVDLVGWEGIAETHDPDQTISLLNGVFTWFDELSEFYQLEKIKTIGSVYMAACNIPQPVAGHTETTARFALALLREWETESVRIGVTGVHLQIGMSVGEVVAGIVGDLKFCYDIYGDAVNTASRMCKFGVPNKIQCTGDVAKVLRDTLQFSVETAGVREIKGKGAIETFYVTGAREHDTLSNGNEAGASAEVRDHFGAGRRRRKISLLKGVLSGREPDAVNQINVGSRSNMLQIGSVTNIRGTGDATSSISQVTVEEEHPSPSLRTVEGRRGSNHSASSGGNGMSLVRKAVGNKLASGSYSSRAGNGDTSSVHDGSRRGSLTSGYQVHRSHSSVSMMSHSSISRTEVIYPRLNLKLPTATLSLADYATLTGGPYSPQPGRHQGFPFQGNADPLPQHIGIGMPGAVVAGPVDDTSLIQTGSSGDAMPSAFATASFFSSGGYNYTRDGGVGGYRESLSNTAGVVLPYRPNRDSQSRRGSLVTVATMATLASAQNSAPPIVIFRQKEAFASALARGEGSRAIRQLQSIKPRKLTLTYQDALLENEFRVRRAEKARVGFLLHMFAFWVFTILLLAVDAVSDADSAAFKRVTCIRVLGASIACALPGAFVLVLGHPTMSQQLMFNQMLVSSYMVGMGLVTFASVIANPAFADEWIVGEGFFTIATSSIFVSCALVALPGLLFKTALTLTLGHAVFMIVMCASDYAKLPLFDLFYCLVAMLTALMGLHLFENFMRQHFILDAVSLVQRQELELEKALGEQLLHNILPPTVAKQLATDPTFKTASFFPSVTVLAMDIAGFTAMSSTMPAEDIVALLNTLFSKFDALVAVTNVEKICTIGDAYVAACGAPEPCDDHADRIVLLGIGMLKTIADKNIQSIVAPNVKNPLVNVRIGIHSGPCFGGIMGGQLRFKYDLYGEAMSVALGLEQTGQPTFIHVSRDTFDETTLRERSVCALAGIEIIEGPSGGRVLVPGFSSREKEISTVLVRPAPNSRARISMFV